MVVDDVGFLPSGVLSLEEPRMLKEGLEDIVRDCLGVELSRVEGRVPYSIDVNGGVVACLKLASSIYGSRLQIEEDSVTLGYA